MQAFWKVVDLQEFSAKGMQGIYPTASMRKSSIIHPAIQLPDAWLNVQVRSNQTCISDGLAIDTEVRPAAHLSFVSCALDVGETLEPKLESSSWVTQDKTGLWPSVEHVL